MRNYPRNSPQAAARIVALAMLSDGHVTKLEMDVLDRIDAAQTLDIDRSGLHAVLHGFCEDLMATSHQGWADACQVDACTLASLLAEVDDPALQLKVLDLCMQVVEADAHVADGESMLLATAVHHWGLQQALLQPQGSLAVKRGRTALAG